MLQLLCKGNGSGLLQRIHIAAKIFGEGYRRFLSGPGIKLAHHCDRGQGVIHKVRPYLTYHYIYLCLVQLLLHFLIAYRFFILSPQIQYQTHYLISHCYSKTIVEEVSSCKVDILVEYIKYDRHNKRAPRYKEYDRVAVSARLNT